MSLGTLEAVDETAPGASLRLRVTGVRLEAEDVVSITLADEASRDLPAWEPGAHLDLELPGGLRRQYSLCGSPEDRSTFTIAVLKEPESRGGSRELHETGMVGRVLSATLRNHFALVSSERYLFIAGGIGVTPLLSMVRSLDDSTPWRLFYGGRTLASMAFADELRAIGGERVSVRARDAGGLRPLDDIIATADAATAIYCCGPGSLIEAVQEAHARLVPDAGLHVERFAASGTGAPQPTGQDDRVELELRRTGVTVPVAPDQNLLEALQAVVPGMPFSCTEGYCGSCEVSVLAGVPDHRDEILTPEERAENRTMFPCVSRAKSERLVLDL